MIRFFWLGLFLLVGCAPTTAVTPAPLPTLMPTAYLLPTETAVSLPPTNTPIPNQNQPVTPLPPTVTPTPTSEISNPPSEIPTPTPAPPNPYAGLTIDELTQRSYGGGQIDILETLEETDQFTRYAITYPSDGLTIHGFMNVPHEGDDFPLVIALHGYVEPDEYETLDYTTRYADELAEAGYFVIHPNLRNYPPSDNGDNHFRVGYAIDVLNLIAIIREQSQDETGYLRRADSDYIHLWGHSMGGGIALRVLTVNPAEYIRGAVLYAAMSGDERQNFERIGIWSEGKRGDFERNTPDELLELIAPNNYLDRIQAPISIHHSRADQLVPVEWSLHLCDTLQKIDHPTDCYIYEGQPHTFNGSPDKLFIQRTIAFFQRY